MNLMSVSADADYGAAWTHAMTCGDWAMEIRINDAVLAARDPHTRDDPTQPYHLRWVWDGTDPTDRDVLVRCYHGLGDTLQFARFLPLLIDRARSVTIEAQPALASLIRQMRGLRVILFDEAKPVSPSSCDMEIMELCHVLRVTPDIVQPPYLAHSACTTRRGDALGVCWAAGAWNSTRSIPLGLLAPVLKRSGRRLISLQRGEAADDVFALDKPVFVNPLDRSMVIEDTLALLSEVAIVITVDSMLAHLAGGLGIPTIVLLKHDPDWRWMASAPRCAWYPAIHRLRQEKPGRWQAVIGTLSARLNFDLSGR